MRIAVAGLGYVGLANAVLLAQKHEVTGVDLSPERVAQVNARQSPVADGDLTDWLGRHNLRLRATLDADAAYRGVDVVIVATPTDCDPLAHSFDTSSVRSVIAQVAAVNPQAAIVVRSTMPVGFTAAQAQASGGGQVVFAPESLREGKALHDSLHPSRIVVGERSERGRRDLQGFKAECDLILANRHSPALEDVKGKVFTRDLFGAE